LSCRHRKKLHEFKQKEEQREIAKKKTMESSNSSGIRAAVSEESARPPSGPPGSATEQPEVVVLDDSLDDDDSTPQPFEDKKRAPGEDIIDLCADDDDSDYDLAKAYAASVQHQMKKDRKKRKRRRRGEAEPKPGDAIEIDLKPAAAAASSSSSSSPPESADPTALYRQALGPVRMDFVSTLGSHSFSNSQQRLSKTMPDLYKELLEYKLNLPVDLSSCVVVRVCESRLDLLRVLITGPEGTPYENGCFFFDVHLSDYAHKPPQVKFLTTGGGRVRFNPNLYNCGKVCLSLLGTWSGPGWQPKKSTLLQVLVSIQGLIFVPEPFFNEPGYHNQVQMYQKQSQEYTRKQRVNTTQWAIEDILHQVVERRRGPYPEFDKAIRRHFVTKRESLLQQLETWTAEDRTLRPRVNRIQQLLAALALTVDESAWNPAAAAAKKKTTPETIDLELEPPPPSSSAAAAAKKAPPETIDLELESPPHPVAAAAKKTPETVVLD
jgi:ubiquitin-protein ligase